MVVEYLPAVIVELHLPKAVHPEPVKGQIYPADPAEQGAVGYTTTMVWVHVLYRGLIMFGEPMVMFGKITIRKVL